MCMVELDPEVSHTYALTSLLCKNGINKHSLVLEHSGSNESLFHNKVGNHRSS